MAKIFAELRRRSMFRAAGSYIVASWVILQVASQLESALELPHWLDTFIVYALAVIFPIAMILAWMYEISSDGIKRTQPRHIDSEAKKKNPLWDIVLVSFLLVVTVTSLTSIWLQTAVPNETPSTTNFNEQSGNAENGVRNVAVLPLLDLSPEGDQRYFAEGISEDLRNILSRVPDLKVASRPSSMQFADRRDKSSKEIASELGVQYLLDGSVRTAGDSIRVSIQIIDALSDNQLFSKTYDRSLSTNSVFEIQDEISKSVVQTLGTTLGRYSRDAIKYSAATGTQVIAAYEAYLEGRKLFAQRNRQENVGDYDKIGRLFQRAIELDSEFSHAWAGLAMYYYTGISWGDGLVENSALAQRAAQEAIKLNPNLGLAHAIAAVTSVLDDGRPDRVATIDGLSKAIELDPFEPVLWSWRGQHWIELGFFTEGVEDLAQVFKLSGVNGVANFWTINARFYNRQLEEGLDRVHPRSMAFYRFKVIIAKAYLSVGDKEQAKSVLRSDNPAEQMALNEIARALLETDYDFESGFERFREAMIDMDEEVRVTHPMMLYIFKRYDELPSEAPISGRLTWWETAHEDFLNHAVRRNYFYDLGLEDYWFERGFPPRCKPIEDSYICN